MYTVYNHMENEKKYRKAHLKTKRQSNAENISEDYPIVRRFFTAIFDVISHDIEPNFMIFCESNNLDPRNVEKLIKSPHFCMKAEWLTILVVKYNYSSDWLLTGRGKMKN